MKTTFLKTFTLIAIATFLFSCSTDDDGIYSNETAQTETIASKTTYSAMELEILTLVNNHRSGLGLKSLETVDFVSGVAKHHTDYMIEKGQVSHDNFEQRSQNIIEQTNAKSVGENVAYGFHSAKGVVEGWLNSDGHRRIIENQNYTHFGIAISANDEGRNYFTHIFIIK